MERSPDDWVELVFIHLDAAAEGRLQSLVVSLGDGAPPHGVDAAESDGRSFDGLLEGLGDLRHVCTLLGGDVAKLICALQQH
jgi:hypothetical protein